MFHHIRKFSSTVRAASPISEINKGNSAAWRRVIDHQQQQQQQQPGGGGEVGLDLKKSCCFLDKFPTTTDQISLRPFKVTDVDDLMAWGTDEKLSRYCNWEIPKSSVDDDPHYCNWKTYDPVHRLGPGLSNSLRPCCYRGWGLSIYKSKEDALDDMRNNIIPHPWYRAICLNNNRPIGKIFVDPCVPKDPFMGEIGYVVASEHWGKGIATTAVNMVLDTIFNEWPHLHRLAAHVNVENLAGHRVLEKAGFLDETLNGGLPMFFLDKEGRDIEINAKMFGFLNKENLIKKGEK